MSLIFKSACVCVLYVAEVQGQAKPGSPDGQLSGKVIDAALRTGVFGAGVKLENPDGTPAKDLDGVLVREVKTERDGSYRVSRLTPGQRYQVITTVRLEVE